MRSGRHRHAEPVEDRGVDVDRLDELAESPAPSEVAGMRDDERDPGQLVVRFESASPAHGMPMSPCSPKRCPWLGVKMMGVSSVSPSRTSAR